MIDKQRLSEVVESCLEGTPMFVTEIAVSPDNNIRVEIDSDESVDIDACAAITRAIGDAFDRDVEDYQLEVGSAGLTSPFKVKAQYDKNIGNEVEILTRAGRKLSGRLVETGDETFTVEVPTKVKHEGAKRPVIELVPETFAYGDCKSVKYKIDFK